MILSMDKLPDGPYLSIVEGLDVKSLCSRDLRVQVFLDDLQDPSLNRLFVDMYQDDARSIVKYIINRMNLPSQFPTTMIRVVSTNRQFKFVRCLIPSVF